MISRYSIRGPRAYQEDRDYVSVRSLSDGTRLLILAVFDGHGGSEAAEYAKENFTKLFKPFSSKTVKEDLKFAISQLALDMRNIEAGTTLSVACISSNNEATIAIVGDSPVIVIEENGALNISPEHNVRTNPAEAAEAYKRGGVVVNGYVWHPTREIGLQMSRALGDSGMQPIVSHEPDIYTVKLGKDSAVLVASDGLIDPSHKTGSAITDIILGLKSGKTAGQLVDMVAPNAQDNVTAVVWRPTYGD